MVILICTGKGDKNKPTTQDKIKSFWRSSMWTHKSRTIRFRDDYKCLICYKTKTETQIEVHHIEPLKDDFSKKLVDDNLITLCSKHHKQAEKGKISKEQLYELVRKQKEINKNP